KLSLRRRAWLSPDGTGTVFTLPETGLASLVYVKNLATDVVVDAGSYTVNLATGQITFSMAPERAVNVLEVCWEMPNSALRSREVLAMRYSETFFGNSNDRVFLYGDGSNRLLYSGLDYDGNPRADYFPDLNVVDVGDSNTPVTGLIKHFSRLICYKSDSTWSISYGTMTLADKSTIPAFYAISVNKAIGNAAPGQVLLVLNLPRTLHGNDLYEWRSNNAYSGNLTPDERQARRISDRIYATLGTFTPENCLCWDDNINQEYYIFCNNQALVHNYAVDAWYFYTGLSVASVCNVDENLYLGSEDGSILEFSKQYLDDDGKAIDAYWESGSMSFGAEYMRKYAANLWVSVQPQSYSYVEVTVLTDRKSDFPDKVIAIGTGGFVALDFSSFTFSDIERAQIKKFKIKAKKFSFYKLVLKNQKAASVATVLTANVQVRASGYVK
ncbi:MAG: hypothetical protein IIW40_05385, partial [Clostridia bacterium]|nr:hypothetical protein [Clostridia bacterium]